MTETTGNARKLGISSPIGSFSEVLNILSGYFTPGIEIYKEFKNKVLLIRYEDLILDIKNSSKRICEFLNIEWHEKITRPGDQSHISEKGMVSGNNQAFYNKSSFNRNVDSGNLNKWENTLTRHQQFMVWKELSSLNLKSEYGYEFECPKLSIYELVISYLKIYFEQTIRISSILKQYFYRIRRI